MFIFINNTYKKTIKKAQHLYLATIFFSKKYIYTINHKKIAINYFWFSLWTGLSGTTLATMIRLELAYPGSHFFKGDSIKYLQVITAHGLIMIFFVVIPLIFGFFANFFIPYHIGAKDVAFPRLNSIGFWIQPAGFFLLAKMASLRSQIYHETELVKELIRFFPKTLSNNTANKKELFKATDLSTLPTIAHKKYINKWGFLKNTQPDIATKLSAKELLFLNNYTLNTWSLFSGLNENERNWSTQVIRCTSAIDTVSGWTFITPFSGNIRYTGYGAQDIAILSVIFAGVSTTISFTNLLITRRTLGMPGLRYRKASIPFLSISLFLVMRMLTLITPVLGAAMIMLAFDRHFNTSFFDYAYGGDTILFHHLFWFFGHPEVYVVIIPAFGIANMLIPFYNHRRIASKNHLIWATYIMGYMGFLVWGHHMYLVGLDHRLRSLYSTVTVMISLPAVVKIVNWTLTFLNSFIKIDLPILFIFAFFLFFLCGGLTGLWLSHVGLNVYVHDTFYVVAHFHFMFSSSTFSAIFAGIYFYYPIIFGKKYNRFFGYVHLFYWFCGQWLTFLPLFWVGYNGLPRRYHDYPAMFSGWHGLSTTGHLLNLISIVFLLLVFLESQIIKQTDTHTTHGIPRLYKRTQYYHYKKSFRCLKI